MPAIHVRLATALALAIVTVPGVSDALARPSSNALPATATRLETTPMLLRANDVPGLVVYSFASRPLSLWESAEREGAQRSILRENGWRGGALRTFGHNPTSLQGVLVIESRVFVFASAAGARRALRHLAPSGLRLVPGRLPVAGGARLYLHQDTVAGFSELALSAQFRQANTISRVMIVGTPGVITRANLVATARRQALRVSQALAQQPDRVPDA